MEGDARLRFDGPLDSLLLSGDIEIDSMLFSDPVRWEEWVLDIREGKVDSARAQVERAESVLREAHDPQDLAKVLCRRGFIEVAEGDEQKARASLGEALALAKQVHAGSRTGVRHLCDDLEALLGEGRTLGHSATQLS